MKERILRHLKTYGYITTWQAIKEYGCTRLFQYIYLLRNEGYDITDELVKSVNRFGESVYFKKYKLEDI